MSVFVGGISKCDPQLSNAEPQAWSTSVWGHRSRGGWLAETAGMVHKCMALQPPTDAKPVNLSPPLQDEFRPASSGQQAQRSSVSIGAVSMR